MQHRIASLEGENRQLRSEASQLAFDTEDCEMAEQRLVQDIASQLGKHLTFCQLPYSVVCAYFLLGVGNHDFSFGQQPAYQLTDRVTDIRHQSFTVVN
jgi:hypothetical protein